MNVVNCYVRQKRNEDISLEQTTTFIVQFISTVLCLPVVPMFVLCFVLFMCSDQMLQSSA
jgi:hypothetical protein